MPSGAAPAAVNSVCMLCPVHSCMARRCSEDLAADWGGMLARRMAVMPGAGELCHGGERLRSLYSVRGGCIKAYSVDAQGNERIRGFYLPGDIVGLDAMAEGICLSTVAAVVPSQVCVAPLASLRMLMLRQPQLAQRIMEQTSRELALALALSGDYSAGQRLAAFLLHLHERMGAGEVLHLPMSQREIGNYLRLATETVCRTLKCFQRRGWLGLGDRSVRFLDEPAMAALAEAVGIVSSRARMARAA